MTCGCAPPEVRRIAAWLHSTTRIDREDAESIAWVAVWRHGDTRLAAVAARRDAIDVQRGRGADDRVRGVPRRGRLLPCDDAALEWLAGEQDDHADRVAAAVDCGRILAALPPRHAEVLRLHWLADMTQAEIAGRLHVHPSRVCQLHREALAMARAV